jgi:putative sterol carrier protein
MSALQKITADLKVAVGQDSGLGKSLKYDLKGEGFIFIDGGTVSNEDKLADLTLTIALSDLGDLLSGKINPMSAVMSGKLKLSNMGLAMQLQSKIQELSARMPK